MITQAQLKDRFNYCPETGLFTRLSSAGNRPAGTIAGTTNSHYGHVSIHIDGKFYKAHRLAFLYMLGHMPIEEVDHLNGIRTDNSWTNLKESCRSENASNCALRSDNTSGVTGIGFHKGRNQWRARVKGKHIGWFATKEEAFKARKEHPDSKQFSDRHGVGLSQFNNSFKAKT